MSRRERLQAVPSVDDPVHHPSHYCLGGIEDKDVARKMIAGTVVTELQAAWWFNAFKYLWRWPCKGDPLRDLKKARECIDELTGTVEP